MPGKAYFNIKGAAGRQRLRQSGPMLDNIILLVTVYGNAGSIDMVLIIV